MTDPNISLVLDELENARQKHPHFVDYFCELSPTVADAILSDYRTSTANYVRWKTSDFRTILVCEMLEALSAYCNGDLAHARQELAQCAAVCIRGMEYIQDEIDKKQKQENDK